MIINVSMFQVAFQSLEEALRGFTTPELLNGNNQFQCPKCDDFSDAHKGFSVVRFPYILTIMFNRFDFDYNLFRRIKLNDRVTFPHTLDVSEFLLNNKDLGDLLKSDCVTVDDNSTNDSSSSVNDVESLVEACPIVNGVHDEDEGICMASSDTESRSSRKSQNCTGTSTPGSEIQVEEQMNEENMKRSNDGNMYELFSISIHSGSATGGHYYAYIKDFVSNNWYNFNDTTVQPITHDDIERTFGCSARNNYYNTGNAYMLMYRKIEKNNTLPLSDQNFPKHISKLGDKCLLDT